MSCLVIGCGYLGRRVASLWREAGKSVHVMTRSAARAEQFAQQGYLPWTADVTRPETLGAWPKVDTVLFAVGYDASSGRTIHEVYVDGLRNLLAAVTVPPKKFIYVSSTGVYGDSNGDWVDEDSVCQPRRDGGRACLEAEHLLSGHSWGDRRIILRMSGLYGPNRIPRRESLVRGEAISAAAEGWMNLIHVEDAARIVVLAERQAVTPRTYLVSDGQPVRRREYFEELCRLLETPPPVFSEPSTDSPRAARSLEDKRVAISRLVDELNPEFLYPSFREGLAAIVREKGN